MVLKWAFNVQSLSKVSRAAVVAGFLGCWGTVVSYLFPPAGTELIGICRYQLSKFDASFRPRSHPTKSVPGYGMFQRYMASSLRRFVQTQRACVLPLSHTMSIPYRRRFCERRCGVQRSTFTHHNLFLHFTHHRYGRVGSPQLSPRFQQS